MRALPDMNMAPALEAPPAPEVAYRPYFGHGYFAMSPSPHKNVLAYFTWSTPALWHGVRAYAREANWMLIAPNNAHGPPERLMQSSFDGVLVLVGEYEAFHARKNFPGTKIVDLQSTRGVTSDGGVSVDHEAVGRMGADYFYELGYRKFVGLRLNFSIHTLERRLSGFSTRLHELGHQTAWLHYDLWMPSPDQLLDRVRKVIETTGTPFAVFSPDDNMADVFVQAATELGYRIPEDIAVLGSNNDRGFCELCRVPLSSIDVNFSRLGYESARLLDRLMEGKKDVEKLIKIPPLMVVRRRSSEKSCSEDPIVNSILEYIGEHFAEKITADLIIQDIHASRSVAYERFRKAIGRSIGKEIERVRMEHAQSFLNDTDYKIDVVARLSGYHNTSAFCRAFKNSLGKTPSDYRLEIGGQSNANGTNGSKGR